MISKERLAILHEQADNKGADSHALKRMKLVGAKPTENGAMITVTPSEMRELLTAYTEKHSE